MEENILVSNIIYISLIVLCLVLIIILFKKLQTTNKLLKTTQDKFHTKLSVLENKYASWEEELTKREDAVREKERELNIVIKDNNKK